MKTIAFPKLDTLDFQSQLRLIVSNAPDRGYSIEDVRTGLKVLDKLDEANTELVLEDAEYGWVKSRIAATTWSGATADIVKFVDAVENPT